ncbi:MAG TPA: YaiI/YqxD family protein [Candidatus Polarisedimenticolia bacterium]|nr:YaiI/YqxD family protein [Candidatus Polarisedimenticolia bacterium]
MLEILVDADGCPVKKEIYRVARRHGLRVRLVSNARMSVPSDDRIEQVIVEGRLDAADDWIVEHAGENDIVITADIPLAARCLTRGARVIAPTGRPFTEEGIGDAMAGRELRSHLRDLGDITGGPAPFVQKDRSRFLHCLDEVIRKILRSRPRETS